MIYLSLLVIGVFLGIGTAIVYSFYEASNKKKQSKRIADRELQSKVWIAKNASGLDKYDIKDLELKKVINKNSNPDLH